MTTGIITILVTGTRTADLESDRDYVADKLGEALEWVRENDETVSATSPVVLVEGGAPGVDTIARLVARDAGWAVETVEASWARHGKAAGPIRNQKMIDTYRPNICVVFFAAPHKHSRGTRDCMWRAQSALIPVHKHYLSDKKGGQPR